MHITEAEYSRLVKRFSPDSTLAKDCFHAFWIGGLICVLGQAVLNLWKYLGLAEQQASTATAVTMVFLGVALTALGVYDRIAKHAGAGTLVPITGFANAVASPAMEFRSEGLVAGMSAKLFLIAGPVLVYGIGASVVYGLILWIVQMLQ